MKAHERSNAGKQYQCSDYGKGFSGRANLMADPQPRPECCAQDQNAGDEQSTTLCGESEDQNGKTASGHLGSGELKQMIPQDVKIVPGKVKDETLHLTVRLQQEEEQQEEREEVIGGFINSDGETVEWDPSCCDNTEDSQTTQTTTSKGDSIPSVSYQECADQRASSSPTLMMEVTSEGETGASEGGEKEERVVKITVAPTYQGKRRGRKRKAPAEIVVSLDTPEEEKNVSPYPGRRSKRKIPAVRVPITVEDEIDHSSLNPVKRYSRRKRAFPTAVVFSQGEMGSKASPPAPAKRPYRKRITIPSKALEKDSTTSESVPGKRRYTKRKSLTHTDGESEKNTASRRPGRRKIAAPIEIPPELLKKPREKLEYHCSVCGKDFPNGYKLERHELTHTGEKPYRCSICARGFNQKGNLKTHYKVHTGGKGIKDWSGDAGPTMTGGSPDPEYVEEPPEPEPPRNESAIRCLECGKECENLSALQAHHITMHAQATADTREVDSREVPVLLLYACRYCPSQFSKKEQLEEHTKTHVKEKPYPCPDCGKRFITESYVQIHQRLHTGEKPFLCSHCGKGYHTASSLKLHEMQHSGDRPFACSLCGKSFRINSYLLAHYQTHIKDRPFLCSVCGKGYARAEELKVHHRLHTGERPYQCAVCGKKFSYRQGLRQHQRTHAGRRVGPTKQLGRPKQQARQEDTEDSATNDTIHSAMVL